MYSLPIPLFSFRQLAFSFLSTLKGKADRPNALAFCEDGFQFLEGWNSCRSGESSFPPETSVCYTSIALLFSSHVGNPPEP